MVGPNSINGSSSRGSGRAPAPATLEDALARIALLEEKLERLEQVLSINTDGSVQISATGQLRLVSANNLYLESGANWIELGIGGVEITSAGTMKLETSDLRIQAAIVHNQAAMTESVGVLRCDTLITNSVIASTYSPGAGNVW